MGTYYHAFAVSKDLKRIASEVFMTYRTYLFTHGPEQHYRSVFADEEELSLKEIEHFVWFAKRHSPMSLNCCCLPRILNGDDKIPTFNVMPAERYLELMTAVRQRVDAEYPGEDPMYIDAMTKWLGDHRDLDIVVYPEVT